MSNNYVPSKQHSDGEINIWPGFSRFRMNSAHLPSMSLPLMLSTRYPMPGSSGPPSEAPSSEISSVESDFSDLRSIAAGLGIVDPDEVYTERFKIDRIKLEDMIKSKKKESRV